METETTNKIYDNPAPETDLDESDTLFWCEGMGWRASPPKCVKCGGRLTFKAQTKTSAIEARCDCGPLRLIVDRISPEREDDPTPLFEAMGLGPLPKMPGSIRADGTPTTEQTTPKFVGPAKANLEEAFSELSKEPTKADSVP